MTMDDACKLGSEGHVSLAVIGDSHAVTLAPAFEPMLQARGRRGTLLVAAGCPPVLDNHVLNDFQTHCPGFNRRVLDYVISQSKITTVVLAARWAFNIERSFYDNGEGGVEIGPKPIWPNPPSVARFGQAVQDVVSELIENGKQVVLVYPVPEPGWDVPRYMVRADMLGIELGEGFSVSHARFKARNRTAYQILDSVADHQDLIRLYPEKQMCDMELPERCVFADADGQLLYFDDDHLSVRGARHALPGIESRIPH